ncbi:hypothetical protein A6A04_03885 [Paramagnetospirillum marisnigri]|uniref:LPS-assembly lipoprotein n=1 Tax=Paramagnetospirillum marisnigri TaxID=1285242 RepID=A0A178MMG2_9PROT|nr:LPS assembly lipoprotein LptE [Paramagnetospirillum marisnigri]OAN49265.1 hypothetical protein A6A04_03885 [Paramagnetospirillum marisnigri]
MWWSRVAFVIALLALGPVGCGFSPIYGKRGDADSPVSADLAQIRIQPIKDRLGQQLRNALVQRLTPQGEPGAPRFNLAVDVTSSASDMGYRRDSFATLGSLTMNASISLSGDGVSLASGQVKTVVYFDYLGPRYASVAMERDAEERAVAQLADDIRSQVAVAIAAYRANPKDPRFQRLQSDEIKPYVRPGAPAARP